MLRLAGAGLTTAAVAAPLRAAESPAGSAPLTTAASSIPPKPAPPVAAPASKPEEAAPGEPIWNAVPLTDAEKPKQRRREGSELNEELGRFERRGDRVVFIGTDSKIVLVALENLALERIGRVLEEDGVGQVDWRVTGTITEFRGTNYLMIRRAIIKSPAADGAPQAGPTVDFNVRPVAEPARLEPRGAATR